MATDPRQAPGDADSVGFMVRRAGRYIVHCCACGKGLGTQKGPLDRKGAADALRTLGWSDAIDGLWRCAECTKNQTGQKAVK